jgi:hypothetical protein
MVAANVGVTKTLIGSILIVTEMGGIHLLPTTLIAATIAVILTSEVGLIHSQRERSSRSSRSLRLRRKAKRSDFVSARDSHVPSHSRSQRRQSTCRRRLRQAHRRPLPSRPARRPANSTGAPRQAGNTSRPKNVAPTGTSIAVQIRIRRMRLRSAEADAFSFDNAST